MTAAEWLAQVKARSDRSAALEGTVDRPYIKALEATAEDVPDLMAAIEAVLAELSEADGSPIARVSSARIRDAIAAHLDPS